MTGLGVDGNGSSYPRQSRSELLLPRLIVITFQFEPKGVLVNTIKLVGILHSA